jgi:hypothetical protein
MNTIRRVMMQINQENRDKYSDHENQIMKLKCYLSIEALKIEEPIGNLRTLKEIMKTIEKTFIRTDEYLLLKTEILIKANEWKEASTAFNGLNIGGEEIQESWLERINRARDKLIEHEQIDRKSRLISYSNCISKNLFEKDEAINKATKLMWNREYQEAIDEACKIWTDIMLISKPELIFAKPKVLQIMIESTLNITLSDTSDTSDTSDAEEWLDTLKKLDYNGIMTAIIDLKTMIRKETEKDYICKQFIEIIKRIGIIEDSIEKNDWYSQMNDLKEYYKELYDEVITIEIPECEFPNPVNIRQTLFCHQDKPENVTIIREEQDASTLHQEIQTRIKTQNMTKPKKVKKPAKKNKTQKTIPKKIETSSEEYDNWTNLKQIKIITLSHLSIRKRIKRNNESKLEKRNGSARREDHP